MIPKMMLISFLHFNNQRVKPEERSWLSGDAKNISANMINEIFDVTLIVELTPSFDTPKK